MSSCVLFYPKIFSLHHMWQRKAESLLFLIFFIFSLKNYVCWWIFCWWTNCFTSNESSCTHSRNFSNIKSFPLSFFFFFFKFHSHKQYSVYVCGAVYLTQRCGVSGDEKNGNCWSLPDQKVHPLAVSQQVSRTDNPQPKTRSLIAAYTQSSKPWPLCLLLVSQYEHQNTRSLQFVA